MSTAVPTVMFEAVAARRISPQAAYLWTVLRMLSGAAGEAITPTNAELQRWMGGYSRSHLTRLLDELAAAGWLRKSTQPGRRWLQPCVPPTPDVPPVIQPTDASSAIQPTDVLPAAQRAVVPPMAHSTDELLMRTTTNASSATQTSYLPVDYTHLAEVCPAPDPQRDQARALWATLLPHLSADFAGTTGLELAHNSAGLPVLIVGVPDTARARALDDGQADLALRAALRASGLPVRTVRFVPAPS